MQPISFGERLATAFVSIAATAITIIVLPWMFSAIGGNAESFLLYNWIFSKLGILILVASAIAGFFLGADRMANVLSFFWGTHSIWEEEWFQKIFIGFFVLLAIGLLVHFVMN